MIDLRALVRPSLSTCDDGGASSPPGCGARTAGRAADRQTRAAAPSRARNASTALLLALATSVGACATDDDATPHGGGDIAADAAKGTDAPTADTAVADAAAGDAPQADTADGGAPTPDGQGSADDATAADGSPTTDASNDTAGDAAGDATSEPAGDTGDGADGADAGAPPPVCGTDSAAALGACVEESRFAADLATIAGARPDPTPHWLEVQTLCKSRFTELGYQVTLHAYGDGINVVGVLPGTTQPDSHVVIAAHYDSVPSCAGADDNGTGVAGVLEAARVLASTPHDRTLVVACWDQEERGLYGSWTWTREASEAGKRVIVDFTFEMIGYFTDEPNTQALPPGFGALFADAQAAITANESRGDFIGLIGNPPATAHTQSLVGHAGDYGLPALDLTVPDALVESPLIDDLRRSDHGPFWAYGYPAIQITDTANFRNGGYHCGAFDDSVDLVDTARARLVVAATVAAAAEALQAGPADQGGTGMPDPCDPVAQDCADGKKCAAKLTGSDAWRTACVDEPADPVGKGVVCERPTGEVGIDTCAPGLFCAYWGMPKSNPTVRQCQVLCKGDADCDAGEVCARAGIFRAGYGTCKPTCDPFEAVCKAGLGCQNEDRAYEGGGTVYVCERAGTGGEGAGCFVGDSECAAGLGCAYSPTTGEAVCRPYCDPDHPCAAGSACAPTYNPGVIPTMGACWPD